MTAEQAISWLSLKPKDLPVFVLVATDPIAPEVIVEWGRKAFQSGVPMKKVIQAGDVMREFHLWPNKKLPD